MKKLLLLPLLYIFTISCITAPPPATFKSSGKLTKVNKEMIWKAAMEVMKEYDLDKINKKEGYISTYALERPYPYGRYIIFIKIYDDHFDVKADVVSGNRMYYGSYVEKENEIIQQITAQLHK